MTKWSINHEEITILKIYADRVQDFKLCEANVNIMMGNKR